MTIYTPIANGGQDHGLFGGMISLMADFGVALAFIRDSRGFLLMQHRDEHAPGGANKWGMPGGQIEAGESALEAVHREVFEETGLVVPNMRRFWSGMHPAAGSDIPEPVMIHAFCGTTTATQDDVVLGEGQAMVFVDPNDIPALDTLPWVPTLLEMLEHHVKADIAEGGVVEGLGHRGENGETQ
ncbi:MAG TPA: NUDIX domain-containing protein [Candidatus Limnocylindrales bacterium]|nr:NUDIX domain-containing protein [Candidatus Limnocylindrales bacterium]